MQRTAVPCVSCPVPPISYPRAPRPAAASAAWRQIPTPPTAKQCAPSLRPSGPAIPSAFIQPTLGKVFVDPARRKGCLGTGCGAVFP